MDPNEESPLQRSTSSTLSAEEFESWTILDRSPKASRSKMKPEPAAKPEKEAESDEEDVEEGDDEEEEESGSEETDEEEEEVQVDKSSKPSGVEPVKNKPKQTKSENVARDEDDDGREVELGPGRKKRTGSSASLHSHDESSDGISVISESDASEHARLLHFNKHLNFDSLHQRQSSSSVQFTPPLSPTQEDDDGAEAERTKRHKQLKRKRSDDEAESTALVSEDAIVPWMHANRTTFVVFSIVLTGIAAILVGNSRVYENRASMDSFNHEQRLSELELENTILKNEMNKLKHLYTRSELDEQVQQAEFEWMQAMDQQMQDQSPVEPEPQPEPEPPTEPEPEQPQVRRVPPQDENIRHKVVWSGDDGQPMLIADKDYVLPEFCYNKNAVNDELFSEYSSKYCDAKQRKIEAKLKKAEYYASKHKNHKHPKDYKQYIHPTAEEVAEHQKQATAAPPKAPSLSPFEFDYLGAFETIKEEGSVILQSLTAILDLDPEPELIPTHNDGYLADDEASSSSSGSPSTSQSTISTENGQPADAINWNDYPLWVREKYENQPEMHRKLQNKAPQLWEWERKKNRFLDEVGLTTLEEVDRRTEDELRQRRQQYEKERGGEYGQKKFDKYDDRKGKEGKYDERKEWKQDRPRNGDNRSHESKQAHKHKEWKDKKEWNNGDKSREYHSKEHSDHPQDGSGTASTSKEASHQKQYDGESREYSSERYKDYRKHDEHSKERKDGEWKDQYKKNGDSRKSREHDSEERGSGNGEHSKKRKNGDWKDHHKKNGDHYKQRDRDSDERSSGDGEYSKERKDGKWQDHNKKKNGDHHKHRDHDSEERSSGDGHHSKERKKGEWKDHHKKNGDRHKSRERDSDERSSSGDGSYMKQEDHKNQYKSKEEFYKDRKYEERQQKHDRRRDSDHDDDDDDDDDDHYKRRHHDKHRNGDYRNHEQKRHKHKDEHRKKHQHHEDKKWHDRDWDYRQSKERRR